MKTLAIVDRPKTQVARQAAEGTGKLALGIAAVAVAPLIAFAALWTCLLVMIGGAGLLHWLGIW